MRRDDAAEGSAGALPATAGATACPLGALCCSFVGNGLTDASFGGGARCTLSLSLMS